MAVRGESGGAIEERSRTREPSKAAKKQLKEFETGTTFIKGESGDLVEMLRRWKWMKEPGRFWGFHSH